MNFERLKKYLRNIPAGIINNTSEIEMLLKESWGELDCHNGGMNGSKLIDRMEDVLWDPPELKFKIERHGAVVNNSIYAEVQAWTINVEEKNASFSIDSKRKLYKKQPRVDVKPIAKEIALLIISGKKDTRLDWHNGERVKISIGKIFPKGSAVQQTLTGRRKRFRQHLTELLKDKGWVESKSNVYITN